VLKERLPFVHRSKSALQVSEKFGENVAFACPAFFNRKMAFAQTLPNIQTRIFLPRKASDTDKRYLEEMRRRKIYFP